jgi:hypothetical protein
MVDDQFYGNIPKIDFNEKYNQYNFLLKETYKKEENKYSSSSSSSSSSSEVKIENRCFGTNLYLSNYPKFTKEKENLVINRCTNKISKKTFCSTHLDLCTYLNNINHEHEKLFSPKFMVQYDNLIYNHYSVEKYADLCKKKQIYRIDIIILFFSLQYDIIIRKERDTLCYHFTKDEGHQKALQSRIKLLEKLSKHLNLDEYKDLNFYECCKYLTYLSYNYYLVLIFTLNISFKYLDNLDIVTSKEYILSDLFDIIRRVAKVGYSSSSSQKLYGDAYSLIDNIVFENEKYFTEIIYPKNKFIEYFVEKNKKSIIKIQEKEESSIEIFPLEEKVERVNIFEHLEDDDFIELDVIEIVEDEPLQILEEETTISLPPQPSSKKKKKKKKKTKKVAPLIPSGIEVKVVKKPVEEIDFNYLFIEKLQELKNNIITRLTLLEEIDRLHQRHLTLGDALVMTFERLHPSPYIKKIKEQKVYFLSNMKKDDRVKSSKNNYFRFLSYEEECLNIEYRLGSSEKLKEKTRVLIEFLKNLRKTDVLCLLWIDKFFYYADKELRAHCYLIYDYDTILKDNHNFELKTIREISIEDRKIKAILRDIIKIDEKVLEDIKIIVELCSNVLKVEEK